LNYVSSHKHKYNIVTTKQDDKDNNNSSNWIIHWFIYVSWGTVTVWHTQLISISASKSSNLWTSLRLQQDTVLYTPLCLVLKIESVHIKCVWALFTASTHMHARMQEIK
jgi:hypothetical protein